MTDTEQIAVDAPIVAVTVYPGQARIERRGRVAVPAGDQTVTVDGLPTSLLDDSVRVGGRGESARVTGIDVAWRHHPTAPDPTIEQLEARAEELRRLDRAAAGDDDALATEATFLEETARRGGREMARSLAGGEADGDTGAGTGAARVAAFGEMIRTRLQAVAAERRDVAERRRDVARQLAAVEAELADRRAQQSTDRRAVEVGIEAATDTVVDIDLSYVVSGAGWRPVYDARLDPDGSAVSLDWHGLVAQHTGEDWPAGELTLSTARPAVRATIPELDPWYIDVFRARPLPKHVPLARMAAAPAGGTDAMAESSMADLAELAVAPSASPLEGPEAAVADQGATAVSYRLPKPVAVPSDGSPHKATIARIDLAAELDYVVVPKLAEEAYLRAKVTNTSTHTLLPGRVSVFQGEEFVGTTGIESVAPGGEVELQLGVDDRIEIERKLTRRDTARAVLTGNRKTAVTYTITVQNHLERPAKVAVLDQFPVSRHEAVKVRDTEAKPSPKERTDLDIVTWELELAPSAKQELTLSFTIESPKNERLTGWTD
jgi:uncharacterized protein (TIGR02231 family)